MIGLASRARLRLSRHGNDRGSLAMLLMVTIVGVALGALLVPIIVNQDRSTRFDTTRVHALDAAQAGIDIVLGEIRNAGNSTGTGDASKLPCGPIAGNAVSAGNASYYAEIIYYTDDPIANPLAQPMICAANFGPYDSTAHTRTPSYACIISTGIDQAVASTNTTTTNTSCATATGSYGAAANSASKGRTIVTTYVFNTDDTNFAGGVIRIYPAGANNYCMDAGSGNPARLTAIKLQPCSTANPPAQRQTWAYRTDLSIMLVSSASSTSSGMCLDSATPHAVNNAIYLDNCASLGHAPYDQQWSIDSNSHLAGAKSDGSNIDGFCINVAGQAADVPLTLQGCTGGTSDTLQTWVPSPSAGAGKAGASVNNLVNFQLFANCLDVTNQTPSSSYLILYTCKQNPNTANLDWNQLFTPNPVLGSDATTKPTAAELVTTYSGTRYCLTSPGTLGGYVTVQSGAAACPASVPSKGSPAWWTIYRTKDSSLNDLSYKQKYVIMDSAGYCLGLGPNSDLFISQYLKIVTTTCNGTTGQKWNADPSTGRSALQNTQEK